MSQTLHAADRLVHWEQSSSHTQGFCCFTAQMSQNKEISATNLFYYHKYGNYLSEWKSLIALLLWFQTLCLCCYQLSYLALTLRAELLHNSAAAAASWAVSCLLISCSHDSTWSCISGNSLFTLSVSKQQQHLKDCLLKFFIKTSHATEKGDRQLLRAAYSDLVVLKL